MKKVYMFSKKEQTSYMVDLNVKSDESVQFMIEEIKNRLKMATMAAIKPDLFKAEHYDDIRDLYDMIISKSNYSISEMEAIVDELGRIKK
jgi:uncharacterized protein YfkK (UPF0435 family)